MSDDERTKTTWVSDDGQRLIIIERWLDRQVDPPKWRSKTWHRKLPLSDVEYYLQREMTGRARMVQTPVQTPAIEKQRFAG